MELSSAAKMILKGKFFDMSATDDMIAAVLLAFGHDDLAIEFDDAAAAVRHAREQFDARNTATSVEGLLAGPTAEDQIALERLNSAQARMNAAREKISALVADAN